MLKQESASFYKRNGYYIEKSAHVKWLNDLSTILSDIDTVILQQLHRLDTTLSLNVSTHKETVHKHLNQLLNLDKTAYIASLKLCANLFSVHSLFMSPGIVEMLRSFGIQLPVLQTTPVMHIMANNLKIPNGYYGIGVHQDWPSMQGSLDTVIVWIPLMGVDTNNFPLELIPGSHLGGLYSGKTSELLYETDPEHYNEKNFVPAELAFGDILYMSSFLLHRSTLTGGDGLRIACSNRYENACEATYINRVYPHAQRRVVNREFIHQNFPESAQVQKIFETTD